MYPFLYQCQVCTTSIITPYSPCFKCMGIERDNLVTRVKELEGIILRACDGDFYDLYIEAKKLKERRDGRT